MVWDIMEAIIDHIHFTVVMDMASDTVTVSRLQYND